ncbi:MAG: hypothetical protein GX196_00825 [Clostridiaceae bacterium]|nr:hypothetical protein [Clostridiaceae bacterium]
MIIRGKHYRIVSEMEYMGKIESYKKEIHSKILKKSYIKSLTRNDLVRVSDDTEDFFDFECIIKTGGKLDVIEF